MVGLILTLGGCHLLFPFEAAKVPDFDLQSEAGPDGNQLDATTDAENDILFPDMSVSDIQLTDIVVTDQYVPDSTIPDTQPPCIGTTWAGTATLNCTPTTVGNCKNGSTITITIPYKGSVSFKTSIQMTGGQPIGYGTISPPSGSLNCNGSLILNWTLPGTLGGDTTQLNLLVTFKGSTGATDAASISMITVK